MGKKHCKIFKQPSEDDVLWCAGTLQHYNPCQLRQSLSSINRCQAQRSKGFAVTSRSLHLAVAVQTMICPPVGGLPLGMPGRVAEERSTRKWIRWSRTSWANSVCQFQEIPGAWAPGTSPSRHPSAAQGDGDASAMGTKVWHSVATLSFPQCQDGMAIGCPHPDFSEFSNSWGSSTVWSHPDPKPTGYPTPDRARQVASFRRISWGHLAAKQRWQLKLELCFFFWKWWKMTLTANSDLAEAVGTVK